LIQSSDESTSSQKLLNQNSDGGQAAISFLTKTVMEGQATISC